ncbi:MAG TPA: ABC transporter permease, partial [Bacteroidota bacterium]|nr:ABC transporter permease [Bacteroidota bacterium]
MIRAIKPVVVKEFRQIRRDPTSLGLLIGLPAVLIILVGYALNFDVKHSPMVAIDWDNSPRSREYLEKFAHTEYFRYDGKVGSYRDVERLFLRDQAKICLVIPRRFGSDLEKGKDVPVQLLVDGSDANTGLQAMSNASRITADYSSRVRLAAAERSGRRLAAPVDFRPRVWYNENLVSSKYLIPGLIGLILVLTAVVSTSLTVVREKERGTMEQIIVSPLHPLQLILGKTIPYLIISLVAATAILILGYFLFDIVIEGSLLLLYAAITIMIVGALGQGLLISSVTDSQQVAFMMAIFSSLLPSFILSGFVFPISSMPVALQVLSNVAV